MIIVDAHQDIAYNALCYERDYRLPVREKRLREGPGGHAENGVATTGLPDALTGRVAVVFATLFCAPQGSQPVTCPALSYRDAREAHAAASRQADYYQRLADESDNLDLIVKAADLDATLAAWQAEGAARRQGLVLLMEGAEPIIEPKQFEAWYARGVRIVGPAWRGTRYAAGTGEPGPLTAQGQVLLDVMRDFNAILDLSHLAEQAFLQALERYDGPVIASHSNPRRFRNSDRHLSDVMIEQLAGRDGVMGIVLYNAFLSNSWSKGSRRQTVPLSTVVDAIDMVCQLTGSARHVGIGTDFDGGFGVESIPDGLDSVADLGKIAPALHERGYDEADVAAIMGGNMLRVLRAALAE